MSDPTSWTSPIVARGYCTVYGWWTRTNAIKATASVGSGECIDVPPGPYMFVINIGKGPYARFYPRPLPFL